MKSTSITFITPNSIDQHFLHASQMHIHAYIQRVHDSEPYSGIQGQRRHLWTLMDPNMYMHHMDIFSHYSLCFFLSYFFPKDIIIPYIINNRMTLHILPIASSSFSSSSPSPSSPPSILPQSTIHPEIRNIPLLISSSFHFARLYCSQRYLVGVSWATVSRKYLASQNFTAAYLGLIAKPALNHSMDSRLWTQVHWIILLPDWILPWPYRGHGRYENARMQW